MVLGQLIERMHQLCCHGFGRVNIDIWRVLVSAQRVTSRRECRPIGSDQARLKDLGGRACGLAKSVLRGHDFVVFEGSHQSKFKINLVAPSINIQLYQIF